MSLLISHRGLTDQFTENSIEAFKEAVNHGFDFLETDLRISSDGEIFLNHDSHLNRVSASDFEISKTSSKDLANLKFHCGSKLAHLSNFTQEFKDQAWTFDIKEPFGDRVIQVLEKNPEIRAKEELRFVIWNSNHREKLEKIFPQALIYEDISACRKAALSYLLRGKFFSPKSGATYSIISSLFGVSFFQKSFTDFFHSHGARILAFLPNNQHELKLAREAQFDEILLDFGP